jgi:ABC-type Fe3+/spermidine/putrescine transport system ATPase subunit
MIELRNLEKRYDSATPARNFNLNIEREEFFTLLGPSGSGKSTILRMIAGLERPDSGEIYLHGQDIVDIPPWKRNFGMVFQHYAIFPHMNVLQNVIYGVDRKASKSTLDHAAYLLELVGLPGYEKRKIQQLSGGEQQRVAIARALAPKPEVLLLDEPLSALDEKIRREMQHELCRIQRKTKTTFIYVTHDQEEALTISDRIAVLNLGKCVQCDEPERIFKRPRTPFVADFFRGCNILDIQATGERGDGITRLCGKAFPITLDGIDKQRFSGRVAVRGENIQILEPDKESHTSFRAQVLKITYRGIYSSIHLQLKDGQILIANLNWEGSVAQGDTVCVEIKHEHVIPLEMD